MLSLATQDSDNPDLRDRGFIYWRLLSTDPAAAKEVVLADKPLISEETDLLEPTLLDELICHISSLASVYHKPPTAFVEGRTAGIRKSLPARGANEVAAEAATTSNEATVIPNQESLIGDLLSMDIGTPAAPVSSIPVSSNVDLLGGGLDVLLGVSSGSGVGGLPSDLNLNGGNGLLGDIFGLGGSTSTVVTIPKVVWLPAEKGKGLEISGTFTRRNGQVSMDMTFTNKAMQAMSGFAVQLNKNSFGLVPTAPLQVGTLQPSQTIESSLILGTTGTVQRMEPLNNLQVIYTFFFMVIQKKSTFIFVFKGRHKKQRRHLLLRLSRSCRVHFPRGWSTGQASVPYHLERDSGSQRGAIQSERCRRYGG